MTRDGVTPHQTPGKSKQTRPRRQGIESDGTVNPMTTAETICTCNSRQFPGNCHCPTCCVSFTGEAAFREHLVVHNAVVRYHLTPTEAGLELRKSGMWGLPGPKGGAPWRTPRR